jgi:hypothetical protein
MRWLLHASKTALHWLIALVILFEEWGWEPLARWFGQLSRLRLVAWIERRIAGLPSYAALAVYAVPAALLVPIKLAALAVIGRGHALTGILIILVAKVAGTAAVARLFMLTKPALMRLGWFAHWYARWTRWKEALLQRVRASLAWQAGRRAKAVLQRRWRAWRGASAD